MDVLASATELVPELELTEHISPSCFGHGILLERGQLRASRVALGYRPNIQLEDCRYFIVIKNGGQFN